MCLKARKIEPLFPRISQSSWEKLYQQKKTRVLTEGKRDRSLGSRTGQGEAVKSMMIPSPKETRERGPELEMGRWWR